MDEGTVDGEEEMYLSFSAVQFNASSTREERVKEQLRRMKIDWGDTVGHCRMMGIEGSL